MGEDDRQVGNKRDWQTVNIRWKTENLQADKKQKETSVTPREAVSASGLRQHEDS